MVTMIDALIAAGYVSFDDRGWQLHHSPRTIEASLSRPILESVLWRFDQLDTEDRVVLESAAAIGLEFSSAAVARIGWGRITTSCCAPARGTVRARICAAIRTHRTNSATRLRYLPVSACDSCGAVGCPCPDVQPTQGGRTSDLAIGYQSPRWVSERAIAAPHVSPHDD